MARYQVGKSWWFPELGRKPEPGEVVELPEEAAKRYMHNEPGLLTPTRATAQAKPEATRMKRRAKR